MNINAVTYGMTQQEKQTYFEHMEKRTAEEAVRMDGERARMHEYKLALIADILQGETGWTEGELKTMSLRTIERIAFGA